MKRLLLLMAAVACVILVPAIKAQTTDPNAPATKEDIQKYFDAIHYQDMMQGVLDAMAKPLHQMVHDQFVKDQAKLPPDFETRMNKMMDDMLKSMPFDDMLQAAIPAYQKHFTKGDMDALTAFYSTPTGQKIMRELPAVTAEAMPLTMPIIRKHIDSVNQRVQQEIADILKNSEKKP